MRGLRVLPALGLMIALAACATAPLPLQPSAPSARPQRRPPPAAPAPAMSWSELPGWPQEDYLGAMSALAAACQVSRDPAMQRICAEAKAKPPQTQAEARAFLEGSFEPEPVPGIGVLTAYFTPEYEARTEPEPPFTAPVRPRPTEAPLDEPAPDVAQPRPAAPAPQPDDVDVELAALLGADPADRSPSAEDPPSAAPTDPAAATPAPAATGRAAIDALPAPDALAWMRPEDLFFMQIQGSGVLTFPDGRRMKASVAGSNGEPFAPIARLMRQQGLLQASNTSGDAIHDWLADHRGPEADAVMDQNPRYIYFRLRPDDGLEPRGAAGVPLPPGRALAMDLGRHAFGELFWVDAEAPVLSGAFPAYRRLAADLDIGAAIKGEVRADLYTGVGEAAGREAGRVRHELRLFRLRPAVPAGPTLVAAP